MSVPVAPLATDDHSGGGPDGGGTPDGGDGSSGSDGSSEDDNDEQASCDASLLTPGAIVGEAELRATAGGLVFREIELVL